MSETPETSSKTDNNSVVRLCFVATALTITPAPACKSEKPDPSAFGPDDAANMQAQLVEIEQDVDYVRATAITVDSCATTKVMAYTIAGVGEHCELKYNNTALADNIAAVTMKVDGAQCLKVTFTRTEDKIFWYNTQKTSPHLIASEPPSGKAYTVSGTYDVPNSATPDPHVLDSYHADNGSPPCPITVKIRRQ